MSIFEAINEIIDIAEIGNYFGKKNVSVQSFGLGDNAINFVNQNKERYYAAASKAFYDDSEISSTYAFKKYQDLLINHFHQFILDKKKISKADAVTFCSAIKEEAPKTFSVLRDIHGIILEKTEEPLILGKYRIYNFQYHKGLIEARTKLKPELIWFNDEPNYLIEWDAKARHFEKAIEIADEQFERFELILRYIIGNPTTRFEVGILNYQGWRNRRAYIFSEDGHSFSSHSNHGSIEPIPLDNQYFRSEEAGHKYAWEITSEVNLNKFQKRVVLAIEWIGQSIAEPSPQSAFLKAAIALEIIFTYSEKSIITPSILNQISEGTALILGENVADRIELESKVKYLYSLRSAIVHSGNKNISKEDHESMLFVARSVIAKLLTSEKLREISSIEKLYELLKSTKYSGSAI
ncbi:hypothetical protein B7G55_15975 [Aeromonas hydrophila]|uniref:HEPN domain-containing protein n=1 Tax=Aeromonas hydrophila TaxID=644 RepID=UPI000A1E0647|nr:HEPN domain-containing protein [Aeromonas hydrophila]OSP49366.1 hypothetical protein B7G55_15975 [Aeromonas hydrophila]